jgi:hypothetical protein
MAAARPFLFDGSQECHLPPKLRRNDNARGHRIRVWGGESPSQTDYDSLGRMTYLHTWRTGTWNSSTWSPPPPPASPDTIQWTYPIYLSLQLSKKYPDVGGTPL